MKIKAGEFKARCLKLMDEVQRTHSTIIITKYGKPIAKLVAYEKEPQKSEPFAFGCLRDCTTIYGNLESTGESWDAESNE